MARLREGRDADEVSHALRGLEDAAREERNVMPLLLQCARAYCTLHEIRHAMEGVFGAYKEPVFF